MKTKLTFLGHAAFLIECGDDVIAIDPFLTGNPSASCSADDITPTRIALTHGHEDHIGDTVEIAKRTGAVVHAAFELCGHLESEGVENLEPSNPGGKVETPFGFIAFTQAFHSSSYNGKYMGQPAGVVVRLGGHTIYHAGDTALFSDMSLIGQLYNPDVAILPAGDRFTMGPAHAAMAAEMIKPRIAIPCHYGTWPLLVDDVSAFKPADVDVRVLSPGESIEL